MLQVTPRLLGSFATVAVKSWLPLARRLAVDGTTATEIAGPPPAGAVESEPQAARRTRPTPASDRCGSRGVLMTAPCSPPPRTTTRRGPGHGRPHHPKQGGRVRCPHTRINARNALSTRARRAAYLNCADHASRRGGA